MISPCPEFWTQYGPGRLRRHNQDPEDEHRQELERLISPPMVRSELMSRLDLEEAFLCHAPTGRAPELRPTRPARRSDQRTPAGRRESPPAPLVQVSAPPGGADPARGHELSAHSRRRPRHRPGLGRSDPSWSSSEADPSPVVPMPVTAQTRRPDPVPSPASNASSSTVPTCRDPLFLIDATLKNSPQ